MRGTELAPLDEGVLRGWNYQVSIELERLVRTGEVVQVGEKNVNWNTGIATVRYRRLRPPRAWWVKPVIMAASVIAIIVAITVILVIVSSFLFAAFKLLAYGAGVLLAILWGVTRLQHSGMCSGIHCGGCRG